MCVCVCQVTVDYCCNVMIPNKKVVVRASGC